MPNLDTLRLQETAITDQGLAHLLNLPQLEFLYLTETKVTDTGKARLKKQFPGCVFMGF